MFETKRSYLSFLNKVTNKTKIHNIPKFTFNLTDGPTMICNLIFFNSMLELWQND